MPSLSSLVCTLFERLRNARGHSIPLHPVTRTDRHAIARTNVTHTRRAYVLSHPGGRNPVGGIYAGIYQAKCSSEKEEKKS